MFASKMLRMPFPKRRTSAEEDRIPLYVDRVPSPSYSNSTSETESLDDFYSYAKKTYGAPRRTKRATVVSWTASRLRVARRSLSRSPLSAFLFLLKCVLMTAMLLLVVTPIFGTSYLHPPPHYRELKSRCRGRAAEPGCANTFDEKVFISVSLYDKGGHLSGGQWGKAVLELIHLIGARNTFLSIYQNDSGPEGRESLKEFTKKVPCRHSIINDDHVDLDGFPNITMPDGSQRMKRLTYLSEIRNRALRPLDTFREEAGDLRFDKVLFLNDVAFRPVDAAQLLFSTNVGPDGRTQYLTTCALDYDRMMTYYDLYATRDAEGYSNGVPVYPIFSAAGSALSRADMQAQRDAVRVKSCWGGMVATQARWLQNLNSSLPRPDFQDVAAHVIDPARPRNVTAPVRFRYEPEVYFDACECCLLLADVSQVALRAGAREIDTFVNPYVRVAYDWKLLSWLPVAQRWERLLSLPHWIISSIAGLPRHNPHRTVQEGDGFVEEVWDLETNAWKLEQRVARNGMFCGVREMQLIQLGQRTGDKNWVNTMMPPGQTFNFPT